MSTHIGGDGNGAGRPAHDAGGGFMVVGLGASAGGIHALKQFFLNVPERSGMAYVVILHLSPDHDSQLASVLQQSTPMPVAQVTEQVGIEPDHVYVIPPNKSLSIRDRSLVLSDVTSVEVRRAPVDIFFRTLAESHGQNAACVVLSGTGANGSMGLKRVKECGGVAAVQEPKEAEYADMPRHSIATGLVDYVLPVTEIPARLVAYRDTLGAIVGPAPADEESESRREQAEEQALAAVLTQLGERTGHDFAGYKRGTVRRRIERRIVVTQAADLPAYARHIREHPPEARALLKDLLISVTNFFRDPAAFKALEATVIPRLFENKGPGGHVRVWVAGCATGEEAYTIAMLLVEHAEALAAPPSLQVFASDIDEEALQVARAGVYTLNDVADVSPERLRRFFTKTRDGFGVRRGLREMVLFARHDLLKDPPFSHLDLVSCRNLLIYLNAAGQARAMRTFHFAMNPGGHLFLGGSETVGDHSDLFVVADKQSHIFQARAAAPRPPSHELPAVLPPPALPALPREAEGRAGRAQERLSYLDLHRRLLEVYAPPSVLVNAQHEIVHLSESAGRFLQIPGGEPTYDLLTVVRPELRMELRAALFHAAQHRANVEVPGRPVRVGEETETVNLVVRPVLNADDTARGFFLVIFQPAPDEAAAGAEDFVLRADEPVSRRLEEEVTHLRSQLRTHTEQYEVQHEELRASNEELLAINEELRSTAEELETSREELQSVNEELTTINQELKIKVEELTQSNNDLLNLMNSTDTGTVFLDRALRVKLFTPRARDIFNLIAADVGRPLADLTSKLDGGGDGLAGDAEQVLERLHRVEREVHTRGGGWYLMRMLPYRTSEDRIEGVVITFLDITRRMRAEESLREARASLEFALDAASLGAWDVDLTTGTARTSLRHSQIFGYPEPSEAWGPELLRERILPEDAEKFETAFARAMETGTFDLQVRVRWPDGSVHWIHDHGRVQHDARGRPLRMAGVTVDLTESKELDGLLLSSEGWMRLLLDSATDYAIFSIDGGGIIKSWNVGAEHVFGFTAAEAIGRHTGIIFTPEDRARGADEAEMRVARETGRAADERWHVRKDGSRFYASGVLTPLGDAPDVGYVKVARDLTNRKRAEERVGRAHEELERRVSERTAELRLSVEAMLDEVKERRAAEERARNLVGQLVTAQEDERRRISRDLHDQLGQQLTALRLGLDALRERCGDREELCRAVEEIQRRAERLDEEIDFLAWEMRPTALDDLGLAASLSNFVGEWSKHYHVPAEFHAAGLGDARLAPQVETCLYRIAQEALNNVYKHAQAARVSVILERRGGEAVLVVEDDGVGFDAAEAETWQGQRGLGLVGMRERVALLGGSVEFESEPGKGSTVFARVPASARAGGERGDE